MHMSVFQSNRPALKGDICHLEYCGKGGPRTGSGAVLTVSSPETQQGAQCTLGDGPPSIALPPAGLLSPSPDRHHPPVPASAPPQARSSRLSSLIKTLLRSRLACLLCGTKVWSVCSSSTERRNEKVRTVLDAQEAHDGSSHPSPMK